MTLSSMRILVVGSGGREHALCWKLAQSPLVSKIFAAPGNPGMEAVAESIPIAADKTVELAEFALSSKVDLTVVGPEGPLVGGIVDYFQSRGLKIFGPTKAAARLEGSKVFAKNLMKKVGVPTPAFRTFDKIEEALQYLKSAKTPIVVKADGLAAGKGAIVAKTQGEATQAVQRILGEKIFGEAGTQVVIEECLEGQEVSVLGIADGKHLVLLEPSQDHKRAFDNDQGPNTGGMGAYSPVPWVDAESLKKIQRTIFEPVVEGLRKEGTPFTGVLYAGLMLTRAGPQVLEFNVRFGDPETQAIVPRLKTDFAQLIQAAVEGKLNEVPLAWDTRSSACVVLASGGYPERYDVGRAVTGLQKAADLEDTFVFHAGTKKEGGRFITSGGRVLNVVSLGETLEGALKKAYEAVEKIQFEGKQFRRDIGSRALKKKEMHSREAV